MPEPLVLVERDGGVATLVLNDPERRNAMGQAMGEAFAERVAELAADPGLRAVILAGAGRAFCAGGDLAMIQERADQARARPGSARRVVGDAMRSFYELFLAVRDLPCPTIAALHGSAVGAGLCVALACDVRLASASARLGLNFTALGLHPGMGATWTLPRLVGPARAAELLYSSRLISGEEAAAMGLVNRALPPEQVLPAARELAAEFAAAGPLANRAAKRALARSAGATLAEQLDFEAREQATTLASRDAQAGLAAARERRKPVFEGG
jgi:enoyl-CoA hydratase/carnithine racemase